jgi:hypothetical protein
LICTKFDDNTPVSAFIARCSAIKTTWQTFYLLFGKGFTTSITDSDMKTSTFKSFDYFADNKMPLEDAARDDSAQDLLFGFAVHLAMPRKLQYKMANKQLWGYNKQKKWLGKDNTPYSLTEADRLSLTTRQLVRSYYNGDGPVDPSTETPGPPRTPEYPTGPPRTPEYPRPHDPEWDRIKMDKSRPPIDKKTSLPYPFFCSYHGWSLSHDDSGCKSPDNAKGRYSRGRNRSFSNGSGQDRSRDRSGDSRTQDKARRPANGPPYGPPKSALKEKLSVSKVGFMAILEENKKRAEDNSAWKTPHTPR